MWVASDAGNKNDMLPDLVSAARASGAVAKMRLKDGLMLFAYPDSRILIIGIGFSHGEAGKVRPELMLRRRSENPARYACWLPAIFADGSSYVLRRIGLAESRDDTVVRKVDLDSACELLLS